MKRKNQTSIRSSFRSGLRNLRSFNPRSGACNSSFISNKRNFMHNSLRSSLTRNRKVNQAKISKEKIDNIQIQERRRDSRIGTNKLATARNTIQSGVSKNSEQFVALVENRARQIGLASFSLFTGSIFITKYNDNCMYDYTCSFLLKLNPQLIIVQENTFSGFLRQRIMENLPECSIRQEKSTFFNETRGYEIFNKIDQDSNGFNLANEQLYTSMAALCALYETFMVENSIQDLEKLSIQYHHADDFVMLDIQTISDMELLVSNSSSAGEKGDKNRTKNSLVEKFKCVTYGGERLLRANFVQPVKRISDINKRQQIVRLFIENYDSLIELQTCTRPKLTSLGLKTLRNFDNLAVKILCFEATSENFNIEYYGRLIQDILSFLNPLNMIKEVVTKLTQKAPENNFVKKCLDVLCVDEFDNFKKFILKNFDQDFERSCLIHRIKENKKLTGGGFRTRKAKKLNMVFWIRDKINIAIDLSRISYSRIQERADEILQKIKGKLLPEKLKIILENKKNELIIKIKVGSMRKTEIEKLRTMYFGDENIFHWKENRGAIYLQTEELKKLSISLGQCYKEILGQTSDIISKGMKILKQSVEKMFSLNLVLSKLDMFCSIGKFSSFQAQSSFPIFTPEGGTLYLRQATDPLNITETTSSQSVEYFLNEICPSTLLLGEIGSGKTTYSLGLLRLVLVGFLGSAVPCSLCSIPLFDFIGTCLSQAQIKDKFSSSFEAEISRVDNTLNLIKKSQKSLVFVDNFGASTTFSDAQMHIEILSKLFYEKSSYCIFATNNLYMSKIAKSRPYLQILYLNKSEDNGRCVDSFEFRNLRSKLVTSVARFVTMLRDNEFKNILEKNAELVINDLIPDKDDDPMAFYTQNLYELQRDFAEVRLLKLASRDEEYSQKLAQYRQTYFKEEEIEEG